MPVLVRETAFDPWAEISRYQAMRLGHAGKFGATATFVGTMRDFNQGDAVHSLRLEHYPGMTEKFLAGICQDALQRWDILDTLIIHRFGTLLPAEPIVLVAVWAAQRAAAFDACRYVMEEVKHRAPFWKLEALEAGERWVTSNSGSEELPANAGQAANLRSV